MVKNVSREEKTSVRNFVSAIFFNSPKSLLKTSVNDTRPTKQAITN